MELAMIEGSTGSPNCWHSSLNSSLSSAWRMESLEVPSISTPHSLSTPIFSSSMARFKPVCPPMPGIRASGRSTRMMRAAYSAVKGSI